MTRTKFRLGSLVGIAAIALAITVAAIGSWSSRASAAPDKAPEFAGITHWINSPPLTMKQLRGKVVLIDFWAYSCINCLRTFPHVTHWYDKYKDDGFVVVGVHSPEFDFGDNKANILRAVKRFGIHYPVAMDNDMATWRAWHNRYWPAEYLVDRQGNVILHHFGEGRYLEMENAIRKQLGLAPLDHESGPAMPDFARIASPEMYLGSDRMRNMTPDQSLSDSPRNYTAPDSLRLNRYALDGVWRMTGEYAKLVRGSGAIHLHFKAAKLHMVAGSDQPVTLSITVDGKHQPDVTVSDDKLYTLFDSDDYREHVVVIKISGPGLRAYTFTFG